MKILEAVRFAAAAHGAQVRKYTGEPYIVHPLEVAATVARVLPGDEAAVIAAILHDTVEDTAVTRIDIAETFGPEVSALVDEVTDPTVEGNRAVRKAAAREHLSRASARGKTIKLADLLNNTKSIVAYDPHFAKVYMREKAELLPVLEGGDSDLYHECRAMVDAYFHLAGNAAYCA